MHLADREFTLSPHNMHHRAVSRRLIPDVHRRHKVCIYGAGLYKQEAPLDDPTWEVWNLNLCASYDSEGRLRADRWFDIHQRVAQTADDLRWIAQCPMPIYVPEDLLDGSPNAVRYPLHDIEAEFGEYWACTFAYQIALALREGYREIGLYGVELAFGSDRERTVEWANVSYWIGRAEERGVGIHLPVKSWLGRHPGRYGFEYQAEIDAVKVYTDFMGEGDELRRKLKAGVDVGG